MGNFLSSLSSTLFSGSLLQIPGDKLEAFVSASGRKGLKHSSKGIKRSVVQYPSGRTVLTLSIPSLEKLRQK